MTSTLMAISELESISNARVISGCLWDNKRAKEWFSSQGAGLTPWCYISLDLVCCICTVAKVRLWGVEGGLASSPCHPGVLGCLLPLPQAWQGTAGRKTNPHLYVYLFSVTESIKAIYEPSFLQTKHAHLSAGPHSTYYPDPPPALLPFSGLSTAPQCPSSSEGPKTQHRI